MTDSSNSSADLTSMDMKWAVEIGRFVMAFGSIEALTYAMLRQCPRDPIAKPLVDANLPLRARLAVLIAIASSRHDEEWDQVAALLEGVAKLSSKRNLIAHSGVTFELSFGEDGSFAFRQVILNRKMGRSANPKQRIAFNDLVKHREAAENLERALVSSLGELLESD